ncbi:MAG: GNAT family N-acetyltransferase [Acidobacteriota bacterium]
MIRPANRADLPRIEELFARANDMPYDLVRVAEEKCFGAGVAGEPEVRVFGDFAGVSVRCGPWLRILAVDRAQRRQGVGTALLRDAEARGAAGIAAEAGNYFTPGVIEPGFFIRRGYSETAQTQNLETTQLPVASSQSPDVQLATGNRQQVLAFIERNFGKIWRFEASRGILFFTERNGAITGFAAHEANNRGLGFFGPAGVAESERGKGLGTKLLLACLADARRLGHQRVVIPWTDAIHFYAKACGARVAQRFVVLRRP